MRILVLGAGVLGCNLAMNLFNSGKDATLLARSSWGQYLKDNGLTIEYRFSFKKKKANIPIIFNLDSKDKYDVIFVTLRFTQLDSIINILKVNDSKNIIFVGNNTKASYYRSLLINKNVMFAFASSAGCREKSYVSSIDLKKITIGQLKQNESNEALIKKIFADTDYKLTYQPNMEDYLLSHACFVVPACFACYYTNGNLKKISNDKIYLDRVIQANIEGYSALEKAGHKILPDDEDYKSKRYYKICFFLYRLLCFTSLGKICVSDHAMNATSEMSALNSDLKRIFDKTNANYDQWKSLEKEVSSYLK